MLTKDTAQILKTLAAIIIGLSLVMLYGIIGAIEGDCYYFFQLLGQYRYCEEQYVGEEQAINIMYLIGALFMFGLGVVFYHKGARAIQYHECPENNSQQT
jgi:hypothetical protein